MASLCISTPPWLRAFWRAGLGVAVCALVGCASTGSPQPRKAAAEAGPAVVPAAKTDLRDARPDAHGSAAPHAAASAAEAEAVGPPVQQAAREPAMADPAAASADDTRANTERRAADEEVGPEVGLASWYGGVFHGRRTALGERFDMNRMTAAHKTMPLPSFALVRSRATGKEVVVRVNDRGPFIAGRIIDLSRAAARELGISGVGRVEVRQLAADDARVRDWHARARAPLATPRRVAVR